MRGTKRHGELRMAVAVITRVTVLSLLVLGNVAQLLFERYDLVNSRPTADRTSNRNSRPRADDGFKVFWNVPSFQCHKYGVNFSSVSRKWGMIQNPEDSFRGDELAILYDPGLFPALLPTTVGRSPELRNGGVPQQGDLSLHLRRFQEDVDRLLPDTRFAGIEIIDFEHWRPVWRQNWMSLAIYKNYSRVVERRKHPRWKKQDIDAVRKIALINNSIRFVTTVSDNDTVEMTTSNGSPVDNKTTSMTAGPRGPVVLQDFTLIDELAHFDRERIPERVAHAKGAGAFGYFEATDKTITKFCKSSLFCEVGKKTDVVVRFSTVGGESGSADTIRDPRGFSIKFYTEDGNWDLVGNNTPIYFIRDPTLFSSLMHSQKRHPQTHLKDPNMFWDFASLRPETTHQLMILFSDRGIPDGYRHMNGYGSHTFKLVNAKNEAVYCKFHFKTDQGIKNLDVRRAAELASSDPDYSIRDLYCAISCGNFPSWTFYVQTMTFKQAETWKLNPFDLTIVWPHSEFPLIKVGKLILNRNPNNYFVDVEQAAFSPAHLVPGIEPSPDKMLHGRLFSYSDAHRHRLGPNYQQLPVNYPRCARVANNQRDGFMCVNDNQGAVPNYYPNSFGGPQPSTRGSHSSYMVSGDVARHDDDNHDNFSQPTLFWQMLSDEEKARLVENITRSLGPTIKLIQDRAVDNFSLVDSTLGQRIKECLLKLDTN